jgi:hypothetical protein
MVNDKLTGGAMPVVQASVNSLSDADFRNISEEDQYRFIPTEHTCREDGESYANLISRHGIANFIFRYATGFFYALDETGAEVASGRTIREVLDSL